MATFSQEERDAYQKVVDEIQQVRELAEAKLAEGEATGLVKAILAVLMARGISVSAEVRARIETCTDMPTLDRWIVRAATASAAEEVMAGP